MQNDLSLLTIKVPLPEFWFSFRSLARKYEQEPWDENCNEVIWNALYLFSFLFLNTEKKNHGLFVYSNLNASSVVLLAFLSVFHFSFMKLDWNCCFLSICNRKGYVGSVIPWVTAIDGSLKPVLCKFSTWWIWSLLPKDIYVEPLYGHGSNPIPLASKGRLFANEL